MNAVERLRRDHQMLRAKLAILEAALGMGPQAWFVLREMSFTLARQLHDHIKREEELVTACRDALSLQQRMEIEVEHRDEPQHLRTINHLFVEAHGHSLERIRPALAAAIEGLRRHMEEEEAMLFPVLERVLGIEESPALSRVPAAPGLDETMTVNRVLHAFPKTQGVFKRLFINVPLEGCTCLDEVAWRHGLDSRELLTSLEEAIEAGTAPSERGCRERCQCA